MCDFNLGGRILKSECFLSLQIHSLDLAIPQDSCLMSLKSLQNKRLHTCHDCNAPSWVEISGLLGVLLIFCLKNWKLGVDPLLIEKIPDRLLKRWADLSEWNGEIQKNQARTRSELSMRMRRRKTWPRLRISAQETSSKPDSTLGRWRVYVNFKWERKESNQHSRVCPGTVPMVYLHFLILIQQNLR